MSRIAMASASLTGKTGLRMVQSTLRVRAAVTVPAPESTWGDELWRLQRLYGGCGSFTAEEAKDGHAAILTLSFHCTDPDWEAINWAPEGLQFEVSVPVGYPRQRLPTPSLRVLGPDTLPEPFTRCLPRLFAEFVSQANMREPAVYRALQYVDRHLVTLWQKVKGKEAQTDDKGKVTSAASRDPVAEPVAALCQDSERRGASWTQDEQKRLEEALVEFSDEPNSKRRWARIADRVGGTRTAQDCADRSRACREMALRNAGGVSATAESEGEGEQKREVRVGAGSSSAGQQVWTAASVRQMGSEVRLVGVGLEGFTSLVPSTLRLQVVCGRCRKPSDLEVSCPEGAELSTKEGVPCPVCKQQLGVWVAPSICHGGCTNVAHVLGVHCHPVQLHRSDFVASCGGCARGIPVQNVGPGYRKRANCAGCFAKLNLVVEAAELLGHTVASWQQVATEEGERISARRQLQDARRHERELLNIKVGQPLPDWGSCKHFRKSYRWMRFPCCGRAFPCGECHDEEMDHQHDWANRMLCGHCSFEQAFSNDKCTKCGASSTRARSAYWEGGQGCRNRTTMAKNDPHKYKGLSKPVNPKASAKGSAK